MALSPADFYAYSRATGVQVPEDPEERAEMAPEVLEFRRNQLKAPEQSPNALQILGTTALAAGAAIGAGLAGRRFLRGRTELPKAPSRSANQGVVQQDLSNLRRAAAAVEPASEPVAPSRPAPGTTENALAIDPTDRLLQELGEMQASRKKELTSRMSQAYGQRLEKTADQLLAELQGESLTTIQQAQEPLRQNQFINAVESGEDQSTGRLIKQLTIGDPWGESTVPPAAVNEQKATLLLPAAASSLREKTQSFFQQRFEKLGAVAPGRYRRERIMGEDPQIAEAMELYASTGDPSVLSRLSEAPSSPLTVIPRVQTELKDKEKIPTGMFYQTTGQGEFVDDLFEKDIKLTNRISSLGEAKQNVLNRLKEIDQLEPQLRFAAADEPGQGGYYTRMLNKVMFEKQGLNPDFFNADLGDAIAQRDFVRAQMESAESLGSQYRLINRQEGVRPFFEVDPVTNQPIPETLEIRTGRRSVQSEEEKTGGGRNYAMYDPASQTGSSIGVYGIEPRNYPIADPELRPTALQREETRAPLRRMPTEGPALKTYIEETKRARAATPQTKQRSIEVSEALRRANIEGRDPNKVLRQLGFNL
jgi:hypothetical protein